jgi:AcrR family transcriptional regulator
VLEAAIHCFEDHGYDETTTAMLASHAHIAVGTLYGYFRDKREILLELLDRTMNEISEVVIARLEPESWAGRDPREHVRVLIDGVFHMQTLRPGIQRVLWERYFKDPDFHEPVEANRERLRAAVAEFARAISESGTRLRPELDIDRAALTVVNAVQWNALHSFMHGTPEEIDATAAATADMVSRYLFPD